MSSGSISPIAQMSARVNPTPRCWTPSGLPLRRCGMQRAVTHLLSQVSLMFSICVASARS
jgi:hypothetical protein